jgi:hypothetical protein
MQMTEEQQAAAVEGALAGLDQCPECKQWSDDVGLTCARCWSSLGRDRKEIYFVAHFERLRSTAKNVNWQKFRYD